jgi:hypothetical protein
MIFEHCHKKYFVFTIPLEFDNYLVRIDDSYYYPENAGSSLNKLSTTDVLRFQKKVGYKILQAYEVTEDEVKNKFELCFNDLDLVPDSIKFIQL